MSQIIGRIKCALGLHAWINDRAITPYDYFPSPMDRNWQNPVRKCARCGRRQWWLPGYGGSEPGCWRPVEPVRED